MLPRLLAWLVGTFMLALQRPTRRTISNPQPHRMMLFEVGQNFMWINLVFLNQPDKLPIANIAECSARDSAEMVMVDCVASSTRQSSTNCTAPSLRLQQYLVFSD